MKITFFLLCLFFCNLANSIVFDSKGNIGLGYSYFPYDSIVENTVSNYKFIDSSLDIKISNDKQNQYLTISPYLLRSSGTTGNIDHIDFRNFSYLYSYGNFQFEIGISKVYWGVTESIQVVDIVNQIDFLSNIDGSDKLGQPLIYFSIENNYGNFETILMPYFRERKFFSGNERYKLSLPSSAQPIKVDYDVSQYQSKKKNRNLDFGFKWSNYYNDLDIGISFFKGTNRDPIPIYNYLENSFVMYYEDLYQFGIEAQYLVDSLTLKLEVVYKSLDSGDFYESVMGLEKTYYDFNNWGFDLGLLFEYLWNDRTNVSVTNRSLIDQLKIKSHTIKGESISPYSNDLFFGIRLSSNDADSTSLLTGIIFDPKYNEYTFSLEASRRVGNSLTLNSTLYSISNASDKSHLYSSQNDDFLELKVQWHF